MGPVLWHAASRAGRGRWGSCCHVPAVLEASHWAKNRVPCPSLLYWAAVLAVVPPAVLIVAVTGRVLVHPPKRQDVGVPVSPEASRMSCEAVCPARHRQLLRLLSICCKPTALRSGAACRRPVHTWPRPGQSALLSSQACT